MYSRVILIHKFRDFDNQGVLRSYDPMRLKEIAPTYYNQITKYGGEKIWNFGKGTDGEFYGVPGISYNGSFHYTPVWRDDWLRNVGINKIPETLEEVETALYAFVNDDPDGNGEKDTYAMSDRAMAPIFGAFGGLPLFMDGKKISWTLVNGKIDASITTPAMKDALTLLNKWYNDGLIDPEWITGENKGQYWGKSVTMFNGTIGFTQPGMFYHIAPPAADGTYAGGHNWEPFHQIQGEDASYAAGPLPIGPEGLQGTYQWGVVEGWYAVYGKNVTDDQLEKWWEVCEVLMTDTLFQDASIYGVPKVDWNYNADHVPAFTEDSFMKDVEPSVRAAYGSGTNGIDRIAL